MTWNRVAGGEEAAAGSGEDQSEAVYTLVNIYGWMLEMCVGGSGSPVVDSLIGRTHELPAL